MQFYYTINAVSFAFLPAAIIRDFREKTKTSRDLPAESPVILAFARVIRGLGTLGFVPEPVFDQLP